MAACEAWLEQLVDAAGEGPDDALRHHLAACAGCRAELAELESGLALLAATRDEPDDLALAGFAARTADRAERYRDRSVRGLFWAMTRGVRLGLGVSTAALAASVALFALARPAPRVVPSAPKPAVANVATAAALPASTGADVDDLATDDAVTGSLDSGLDGLSDADLAAFDQLLDDDPT